MTPDAHGYLRCSRCRCWRPATTLTPHVERYADVEVTLHHCTDAAVCSRLADVGGRTLHKLSCETFNGGKCDCRLALCACDDTGPCLEHEHEPDDDADTGAEVMR